MAMQILASALVALAVMTGIAIILVMAMSGAARLAERSVLREATAALRHPVNGRTPQTADRGPGPVSPHAKFLTRITLGHPSSPVLRPAPDACPGAGWPGRDLLRRHQHRWRT